jgi:hypothetical protein
MPKRFIDSDMWSDAFFEELSHKAKLLFIYLVTCSHTSQAGIGQATDKKVSAETDLRSADLPGAFSEIADKVERQAAWYWIKNFTKHQTGNNSFLKAAVKYAKRTPFFNAFIQYNGINENELLNSKQGNQHSIKNNINQHSTGGGYTVATPCLHPVATVAHSAAHLFLSKLCIISPSPIEIENMIKAIDYGITEKMVEQFALRRPDITGLRHDWQLNELMAQKKIEAKESKTPEWKPEF